MAKQRFTTRFDEAVLALAEQVATAERRSVTSVFEVALLDYATKKGIGGLPAAEPGIIGFYRNQLSQTPE